MREARGGGFFNQIPPPRAPSAPQARFAPPAGNAILSAMTVLRTWDEPQPVRLTVADFELLDRSGAFDVYARTELIDGTIVAMNSQYAPHAWVKSEIAARLRESLKMAGVALRVISEVSVRAGEHDEPMPDVVVTERVDQRIAIPAAGIRLVVEVADTTLAFDLGRKAALYARAAIPECWIVSLADGIVHRLTGPTADGYSAKEQVPFGHTIRAHTLPAASVLLSFDD